MTARGEPPLPQERLDPGVRLAWRLQYALRTAFAVLAGAIATEPLDGLLAVLAPTVPLAAGLAIVVVLPGVRYRRWRFEVGDEEIDLRHGGFTLRRTLVPMRRVQHVDSSSGVVERALDLATLTVHTAAGTVSIPGLEVSRSWQLHERIAELARLTDDD